MKEWYYAINELPDDSFVDNFADSKFGIERWKSFTREIIQNSVDAVDDEGKPVRVVFDLNKELSLTDIPGGEKIRYVLERCYEAANNPQTERAYKKGLEILDKEKIYCLKVSDYNTIGVKTGRDEAWGALVCDEGKSVKQRPGSAGSHGVGKKVPFIISTCNTVFYATKNKYVLDDEEKSDLLFQGKNVLITWTDDDQVRRYHKGFYGNVEEGNEGRNKVLPINGDEFADINNYFLRESEYGTDVTIVGVNAYNNEEDIKNKIICSILDNFFVSILENKLIVEVFGEIINKNTFSTVVEKYYATEKPDGTDVGEFLKIFNDEHKISKDILLNETVIGSVDIYFSLGNNNNKKYYAIVRDHGMKITEKILYTDQPYTCLAIVRGDEVNQLIRGLENAAHDEFITDDPNMDMDEKSVSAFKYLEKILKEYIHSKCKIKDLKEQEIEGLENILSIPGQMAKLEEGSNRIRQRKSLATRSGMGHKDEEGKGYGGSKGEKKKRKRKGTGSGPVSPGGDVKGKLFDEYLTDPVFIKTDNGYILKFATDKDLKKASVAIHSINSEGQADSTLADIIEKAYIGENEVDIKNGIISDISLKKNEIQRISFDVKKNLVCKLRADVYYNET